MKNSCPLESDPISVFNNTQSNFRLVIQASPHQLSLHYQNDHAITPIQKNLGPTLVWT